MMTTLGGLTDARGDTEGSSEPTRNADTAHCPLVAAHVPAHQLFRAAYRGLLRKRICIYATLEYNKRVPLKCAHNVTQIKGGHVMLPV